MRHESASMTAARTALIHELEQALNRQSGSARADMLRRIGELFASNAARCDTQQILLFDEVLLRLIDRVDGPALVEIAECLAATPNAPAGVVGVLARRDDSAVAGPVLSQAERLSPTDLEEIAETKSQDHMRAICARSHLDYAVTDVLVRRGNSDVLHCLAANRGAQLSEASFANLFALADKDDVMAENLVQRSDLPQHLVHRMLVRAPGATRQRLLTVAAPDVQNDIGRMVEKIDRDVVTDEDASESAMSRIQAQHQHGQLTEHDLLNFAQAKKFAETIAALSCLCSVPFDMVEQLMDDERVEPVLILCKAGGFEWPTARAVVQLRPRSRGAAAPALTEICEHYRDLQLAGARQMLSYWRSRAPGR